MKTRFSRNEIIYSLLILLVSIGCFWYSDVKDKKYSEFLARQNLLEEQDSERETLWVLRDQFEEYRNETHFLENRLNNYINKGLNNDVITAARIDYETAKKKEENTSKELDALQAAFDKKWKSKFK